MKRILPIILVVCMMLCACAKEPAEQTTDAVITPTENVTTVPTTEEPTTAATEETTEPVATEETVPVEVGNFRNPINGTPLSEEHTARPYAVVINNIVYAQPMCSIGSADFVFEVLTEGGITRCLAVYSDISEVMHIGAIRSARPCLVDLASSFDAIFIHHGGSVDGYDRMDELGTDDIDALSHGSGAFYRDQNRLDVGYDLEHTSFADGDDLMDEIYDLGYKTELSEGVDFGFLFDDVSSTANGQSAEKVKVTYTASGKTTKFTFDNQLGRYKMEQFQENVVDGNTDKAVSFRNVIVLNVETYNYELDGTVRVHVTLTGEGTGYLACDGRMVPICWSRNSNTDPFAFTMEDGTPLTLGVGNTFVAVTPLSGDVEITE